ncbi:DUF2971 domain-containing protein [Flectobacillus roseus]|uniref:DUF2971 domain-containing protein n=1 Tax=Flectobacillus roseus TaxID=502259 RepID=A0ABT6Y471_9BACT|nr:DUF2971 domain-containing protein [Flectobacillus roseus]MDI9858367.1 DUF2971 domain-containing protein [Flectobacillus roseus]
MILYKHLSVNDNTTNSLEENYIWFSSREVFNDPYDCKVRLAPITDSEIQHFVELKPTLKSLDFKELSKAIENGKIEFMDNYTSCMGVSCFTSKKDNILMWSHYSEKHKGISLGFETDELKLMSKSSHTGSKVQLIPEEVNYSEHYPEVNIKFNSNNNLNSESFKYIFLTKANVWSYENEYRYISFELGKHTFNKNALKEVIFGVNVIPDKKTEIIDLIKSSGYKNIKFYECKLNSISYSLDTELLNT